MHITLNVSETVSARLRRLAQKVGAGIQAQATRVVGNAVKAHLIVINRQRPNALGGKRTNYYAHASRGAVIDRQAGTVTIVQRGFRHQVKGGTIRPSGRISAITGKPITHLAIPIHKEAHGFVPSDDKFKGKLFLLRSEERNQALLARQKGRGKRATLEFLYVLKTSVTKQPDPTLLPERTAIHAAIHAELKKYLERSPHGSGR